MFSAWRVNKNGETQLGIEATDEGIAIARIARDPSGPRLSHCEYLSRQAIDSPLEALAERAGLRNLPCNWVLSPSNYTLLLLEAPKVPPEEMREAMRWRIKDLISFPLDQATLDLFELPEDGSRGRPMLYVVAAERPRIAATVDMARQAGLALHSIDISELALRNLADLLPGGDRGLALVRLQQGRGNLVLIRKGRLYLSRQFELPYQAGLFDPLPEEALVLELQRSLDYFERQMGQEAPSRIVLCGENINPDKLTDSMRSSLAAELSCLDFSRVLRGAEQWDEHLLQLCTGAIGAALRQEVS